MRELRSWEIESENGVDWKGVCVWRCRRVGSGGNV